MVVNRITSMGGRSGSGARGARGGRAKVPTMGEVRAAQKALSSAQAQLTKTRKEYQGALGYFYYTAQSEWAKQEAKTELNKASAAYEKAQKKYQAAKAVLDAKSAAYRKGSGYSANDVDLPF